MEVPLLRSSLLDGAHHVPKNRSSLPGFKETESARNLVSPIACETHAVFDDSVSIREVRGQVSTSLFINWEDPQISTATAESPDSNRGPANGQRIGTPANEVGLLEQQRTCRNE